MRPRIFWCSRSIPTSRSTRSRIISQQAKKNPGKMTFGSSGPGSPHHLAGELLMQMADIKLQHIPYKGGGQTINDLAGGHIPSAFLSLSAAKPLHDAGKIRIIGVAEAKRYSELPECPDHRRDAAGLRNAVLRRAGRAGRHAAGRDREDQRGVVRRFSGTPASPRNSPAPASWSRPIRRRTSPRPSRKASTCAAS